MPKETESQPTVSETPEAQEEKVEEASLQDTIEYMDFVDGEVVIKVKQKEEPTTPVEPEPEKVEANKEVETQDAEPKPIDWEKRYKDLEPEFTRRSQELAELKRRGKEDTSDASDQDEDDWNPNTVFASKADAQRWVLETMRGPLTTLIEKIAPVLVDYRESKELTEIKQKYADLAEYQEQITLIQKSLGSEVSLEQAYQLAKQLKPSNGKVVEPTTKPSPVESVKPKSPLMKEDRKTVSPGGVENPVLDPQFKIPEGTPAHQARRLAFQKALEDNT